HQLGAAGRGRILDVGRRVADAIEEAVDAVVAQRRAVFVGTQFRGQREVGRGPAHCREQFLHRCARARTRVADVEALALQIREALDARIRSYGDRERFRMQREHGAQVLVRTGVLEAARAVVGVILPVRLRHAEVEFAGADGVEVVDRAAGTLDRTADTVLLAAHVDQAADRAAGCVIDASDAAGADGDELLLGCDAFRGKAAKQCEAGGQCGESFHERIVLSLWGSVPAPGVTRTSRVPAALNFTTGEDNAVCAGPPARPFADLRRAPGAPFRGHRRLRRAR